MAIKDIINSFDKKKILILGDTILDIYSQGKVVCLSSDSEAPEIEEGEISVSFGGASLVTSNILELGGCVTFFSVVGDDEAAKHYEKFQHPNLEKYLFVDKTRPTIVKKRFWANGQKLFQANQVDNRPIDADIEEKIINEIESLIGKMDVVAVLDAQHGLMSPGLIEKLKMLCQKYQKPLYVDSQISHRPSNHQLYQGADCLFFNQTEAKAVLAGFDAQNLEESLKSLKEKFKLNNVVIKLGERGSAALFNGQFIQGHPYKVKVIDPCGAGDTFLAAFTLGDRQSVQESLDIANTWAALSTTILGTVPPKKQDLIKIIESEFTKMPKLKKTMDTNNIKLILTTIDPEEAEEALEKEILSGISTNLSNVSKIVELCKKYNQAIPVSVAILETDPEKIIKQAGEIAKEVNYDNLIIRLPIGWEQTGVIKELSENNIQVECSSGMNEAQAILAANAGARYFSLQASRIKDLGGDSSLVIKNIRKLLKDFNTEIIVSDIRPNNMRDAIEAFLAGAHIISASLSVLEKMASHPKTTENVIRFVNAYHQWGKQ